jgi:DNA-binding NarL/FixJ family response regulator
VITVAIVEDHPIFRQGLSQMIEAAPESVEMSGVYRSLEDFLRHAPARIDIVLLDLHLPGIGGAEAVRAIHERGHHVLVVSASDSPDIVVAAIAAGANGYLTKDAEASEILRAVSEITGGGTYVSPTLASHLLAAERRRGPTPLQLSDREREILALVAAGERDQDIAEQLFISIFTVRSHLDRIRDKTGRRRRPDLTRLAAETGLTGPSYSAGRLSDAQVAPGWCRPTR